jgi:putative hydrolase of the HAD superfamily
MALGGLRVRAILLDGLGTLVALQPPWQALAAGLWRDHRIELTDGEAQWAFMAEMQYYRAHHLEGRDAASLHGLRERCAQVLYASLPPRAANALSLRELTASMLEALRFSAYPDALATLPLLRARGLRLVAVSNWDVSLAPTLRGLGLGDMLDAVITSAHVGAAKPAPEVFTAALAFLGLAPREVLHVGDDPRLDVPGARAAGVLPVLLRREGDFEAPAGVATISSLTDLPGLI